MCLVVVLFGAGFTPVREWHQTREASYPFPVVWVADPTVWCGPDVGFVWACAWRGQIRVGTLARADPAYYRLLLRHEIFHLAAERTGGMDGHLCDLPLPLGREREERCAWELAISGADWRVYWE